MAHSRVAESCIQSWCQWEIIGWHLLKLTQIILDTFMGKVTATDFYLTFKGWCSVWVELWLSVVVATGKMFCVTLLGLHLYRVKLLLDVSWEMPHFSSNSSCLHLRLKDSIYSAFWWKCFKRQTAEGLKCCCLQQEQRHLVPFGIHCSCFVFLLALLYQRANARIPFIFAWESRWHLAKWRHNSNCAESQKRKMTFG